MEIQRINNSTPAFKGFVGASVVDILNRAVKNSTDEIVRQANKSGQVVEGYKLVEIYNKQTKLFDKLNKFMKKFHPDTYLGINDYGRFFIANNKVKKSESCYSIDLLPKKNSFINTDQLSVIHLDRIDKWADDYIAKTDTKAVDYDLFNRFTEDKLKAAKNTSILTKLRNYFAARKLNELAPEFGAEGGWGKRLEAARQEAITAKNLQKANSKKAKEIEKENQKIAEDIAKRQ